MIWETGATGGTGYFQTDPADQPKFIADNTPPDYNDYHLPSTSYHFAYGKTQLTFAQFQANGADVHGTVDRNNTSGFPSVAITSPADQASVTAPVTVKATASDKSGINRVEFYVDWKLQKTVAGPPYTYSWTNGPTGSHILTAMAYSNAGIRNCFAVTLHKQ